MSYHNDGRTDLIVGLRVTNSGPGIGFRTEAKGVGSIGVEIKADEDEPVKVKPRDVTAITGFFVAGIFVGIIAAVVYFVITGSVP